MPERGEEVKTVTVGGKGSSLSSSSVYAIAAGSAKLRIDSYALDRLSNNPTTQLIKPQFPILQTQNPLQSRASIVLLINKLLRCSGVRSSLLTLIAESLNSGGAAVESVELTEDEFGVVEKLGAELYGICALVDHEATALGAVVGAVAALSCEAGKADMTAVLNLTDSGDGLVNKEQIGVASDMKVLLNGSKFVGKVESEAVSVIPTVVGNYREVVKLVHSRTRVELNSPVEVSKEVAGKAVCVVIYPLVFALRELGESSLLRAKMNLEAVEDEGFGSRLAGLFEKNCPTRDVLYSGCKLALNSYTEKNYGKFVCEVNALLGSSGGL